MMTSRLALALLGGLLASPASAALISHRHEGMVVAIDQETRKLTVTDHRGRTREFAVGDDVEVKDAAGNAAKLEDVTSFDELVLTYKGDRVTRIQIRPPRQQEERLDDAAPQSPP